MANDRLSSAIERYESVAQRGGSAKTSKPVESGDRLSRAIGAYEAEANRSPNVYKPESSWLKRYKDAVTKYNDFTNSRNGGWTNDASGGTRSEFETLIKNYDAFSDKLNPGLREQYDIMRNHVQTIYDDINQNDAFYSQWKDGRSYDLSRSGFTGANKDYKASDFYLTDEQAMGIRGNLYKQNLADMEAMKPEVDAAKAELDRAKRDLSGLGYDYDFNYWSGRAVQDGTDVLTHDQYNQRKAEAQQAVARAEEKYNAARAKYDQIAGYNQAYEDSGIKDSDDRSDLRATKEWQDTDTTYHGPSVQDLVNDRIASDQSLNPNAESYESNIEVTDKLGLYRSTEDHTMTYGLGKWDDIAKEGNAKNWDKLDSNEVQTYYYLLNNQGQDAAYSYLDGMTRTLNYRADQDSIRELAGEDATTLALLNLASVPASVYGNITSAAATVGHLARGEEINEYGHDYDPTRWVQNLRSVTEQKISNMVKGTGESAARNKAGDIVGKSYQAVMSALDSAFGARYANLGTATAFAGSEMAGLGYTAVMGLGAGSQRAIELQKQGASRGQIAAGALGSALIEAATELGPIDTLMENVANRAKFLKGFFEQAMGEGLEEGASDILNLALDATLRGFDSDHSQKIRQLMADKDMTYEEAQRAALKEQAIDTFWSMYSGALSGGLSYGAASVMQNAQEAFDNVSVGQGVIRNASYGDLQEQARNLTDEAQREKLAKRADEMAEHNRELRDRNIRTSLGTVYRTGKVATDIANQAMKEASNAKADIFRKAAQEYVEKKSGLEKRDQRKAVDALVEAYSDGHSAIWNKPFFTRIGGSKMISEIVKGIGGDAEIENAAKGRAASSVQTFENVRNIVTGEQVRNLINDSGFGYDVSADQPFRKSTESPVNIQGVSKLENGRLYLKTNEGDVEASDITYGSQGEAFLYSVISSVAANTNQAASLMQAFGNSPMDAETFGKALRSAFLSGKAGTAIRDGSYGSMLNTSLKEMMLGNGAAYTQNKVQSSQKDIQSGQKQKANAGVEFRNIREADIKDASKKSVVQLCKALSKAGLRIGIYESTEADRKAGLPNGKYYQDGTIWIDLNAGGDGRGISAFTVAHELTHYMEGFAADKFQQLGAAVFEAAGQQGISIEGAVTAKIEELRQENPSLYKNKTAKEMQDIAYSELVAEAMETVLVDTDALTRLSGKIHNEDKTLWNEIGKILKNVANQLRKFFGSLSPDSVFAQALRPAVQQSEEIAELWASGIHSAMQAANSIEANTSGTAFEADTSVEQRMLQQAETDAEALEQGEVRNSIRYAENNRPVVVVNDDITRDTYSDAELIAAVKESLRRFKKVPIAGQTIRFTRDTANEYTGSNATRRLRKKSNVSEKYNDKMRLAAHPQDIVYATTDYINEAPGHARKDDLIDFARGKILIDVSGRKYEAEVVIGYSSNGTTRLHDIVHMNRTNFAYKKTDTTSNLVGAGTAPRRGDVPSVSNSIADGNDGVNTESRNSSRNAESDMVDDYSDWLEDLDIDSLMAEIEAELNAPAVRKPRAKARVDEVNKVLKKWGLQFNGTKKAALTTERIDAMLSPSNYGAGNDYSQAWITYMNPMDFLRLTAGGNVATTDNIEARANSHDTLDLSGVAANKPIRLDIASTSKGHAQVVDHDGRARMLQLGRAGFDQVPVLVFDSSNGHYGRQTEYGMKLKPQTFFNDAFISGTRDVTTDVMVPFSKGNRNMIINTFGDGTEADMRFSQRMSPETRQAVKDALKQYKDQQTIVAKATKATYEAERNLLVKNYKQQLKDMEKSYSSQIDRIQAAFFSIAKQYEQRTMEAGAANEKVEELWTALQNEIDSHDVDRAEWEKEFAKLKNDYKKSGLKVEALEKTVADQKAAAKEKVKSHKKVEMRHRIATTVKTLEGMMNNPKDKFHVPESMRPAVAAALKAMNDMVMGSKAAGNASRMAAYYSQIAQLTSRKDADSPKVQERIAEINSKIASLQVKEVSMQEAITKMQKAYSDLGVEDPSFHDDNIDNWLKDAYESVGDTAYSDLSLEQLSQVYDAYRAVLTCIRNHNEAFKEARGATISSIAGAVWHDLKDKGERGKTTSARRRMMEDFSWNNEKPVYAFDRIGSKSLSTLYTNLRRGEDTWYRDVSGARAFFMGEATKYGYDDWDLTKTFDFESSDGRTFTLSLSDIMSLYAYSLRPQALDHLTKGGIVINQDAERIVKGAMGIKHKVLVDDTNAYAIKHEDLVRIQADDSILTPKQRAFCQSMQQYLSTVMGAKGNEVSMALYDIKIFKEQNYWPLKSSEYYSNAAKEQAMNPANKMKNAGFTKSTVQHASNPVVLTGFMETWAEHVNKMSMYHSFTLPMEDFYRVYNYRTSWDGGAESRSTQQLIEATCGKGAVHYIDTLLQDLNGGLRADPRETIMKGMFSKFKKGAVFASASVTIQQPSAVVRAFSVISPQYFVGRKIEPDKSWEQCKKYAPVAGLKEMGRFDMDMGRSTEDYIIGADGGIMGKMDEILGKAPELADQITWCAIWEAAKRQTADRNPSLSGEALLEKAGLLFEECITKTQVYDSVFSRSGYMRSKSTSVGMWTSFMAEPTTTANMVEQAVRDFARGNKINGTKTAASVLGAVIFNAFLASFVYAARDDDEDKSYWEKYLSHFASGLADGVNPMQYIVGVKDVWSLMQGYDVDRPDLTLLASAISSSRKIVNVWETHSDDMTEEQEQAWWKSMANASWSVVDNVTALFGVPEKNIRRDFNALLNLFKESNRQEMSDVTIRNSVIDAIRDSTPFISWMQRDNSVDLLYKALISGDRVWIERAKRKFNTPQKLDAALVAALKKHDPRIRQAAEVQVYDNDNKARIAITDEIKAEGIFTQNQIVKAVNSVINHLKETQEEEKEWIETEQYYYSADDYIQAVVAGIGSADAMQKEQLRARTVNGINKYGRTQKEAEAKALSGFKASIREEVQSQFEDGMISEANAVKVMAKIKYYDDGYEKDAVHVWAVKKDIGVQEGWSDKKYLLWDREIRQTGISLKVYDRFVVESKDLHGEDKNGDGKTDAYTTMYAWLNYIDSLPISAAQKDALLATTAYYGPGTNGWKRRPWAQ